MALRNSFLSTVPEPSRSHCLKSVMTRPAERFSESRSEYCTNSWYSISPDPSASYPSKTVSTMPASYSRPSAFTAFLNSALSIVPFRSTSHFLKRSNISRKRLPNASLRPSTPGVCGGNLLAVEGGDLAAADGSAASFTGSDLALLPRRPCAFLLSVSILPFAPTCRSFARVIDAPCLNTLLSSLKSTSPPPSPSIESKTASSASFGASNPNSLIALRNSFLSTVPEPSRSHCLNKVMTRPAERLSESRSEYCTNSVYAISPEPSAS